MNIALSDANYEELITGLVGLIVIVIANSLNAKRRKLVSKGIKVDGIVYALGREAENSGTEKEFNLPIIRFVTAEKEWVTEKYTFAVNSSSSVLSRSYQEGDKVIVIYDPENVTDFIIDDFNSKLIGPLFTAIGMLLTVGAIIHFLYFSDFHF